MSAEQVPEVLLEITDSPWPHADGHAPGVGICESFSTEREIVSSGLPSQIRARTGFSIGSGSASVGQPSGQPFTPYAGSDRRIEVGKQARLAAVNAYGETETLGSWKVANTSGGLNNPAINVDLSEPQYGSPYAAVPAPLGRFDAAWIISVLGPQIGCHAVPPTVPTAMLSVPGVGGLFMDAGGLWIPPPRLRQPWSGGSGPTMGALGQAVPTSPRVPPLYRSGWVDATYGDFSPTEIDGIAAITGNSFRASVQFGDDDTYLTITTTGCVLKIRDSINLAINPTEFDIGSFPVDFPAGLDANHPSRVQLRIRRTSETTCEVRARSAHDAAWSDAHTINLPAGISSVEHMSGAFNGLQITTDADPLLWARPTARIPLLDGICQAPTISPRIRAWDAIREVCDAFYAGAWIDRHGVLQARSRHQLAGLGRREKVINIETDADSLNWSLAADDFADQLEVDWTTLVPDEDAEEWSLGERVQVRANARAVFFVDLETFVPFVYPFAHVDSVIGDDSTWEANTGPRGEGTPISSGLTFSIENRAGSSVRVTVENENNFPVWLVDEDGEPAVIVRGTGALTTDPRPRIEVGLSAGEAVSPLSIDLSPLVQDESTAIGLVSFLWDRCQSPRWRIGSVRIRPDLNLDMGSVVALTHAPTGLSTDALVTRVQMSGDAGEFAQRLDLAILPPTVAAFDQSWAGSTVADFDTRVAGVTAGTFDATPMRWS